MRPKMRLGKLIFRFAGENGAGGSSNPNNTPPAPKENNPPKEEPPKKEPKSYTEEQIKELQKLANSEGVDNLLKSLNIESVEDLNNIIKTHQETLEKNMTDLDKEKAANKALTKTNKEMEARATVAENKLTLIKGGVKPEFVDEALVIVQSYTNKETPFEKAMEKAKEKLPNFFNDSSEDDPGTGGSPRSKKPISASGLGARLAKPSSAIKNPYFN